jgi:hypothetical protein
MPGARRTRSLVCKDRKHTSVVTAGTPDATRHSLHDGVTAYFVLSPVTGLFVTVASAIAEAIVANLNASIGASGPPDFAVRRSRARLPRKTSAIAFRAQRP